MGIAERFEQFSGTNQQAVSSDRSNIAERFKSFSMSPETQAPSAAIVGDTSSQKSAISLLDRVQFSFADEESKERLLRERFPIVKRGQNGKFVAGESVENLQPIDPEGVFNDVLGDLADITSEIPVVVGQIMGGTLGSLPIFGGPVGTIVGGGLGAGLGEGVKKAIGKSMNINKQDAEDIATDMVITSAFGAAGEGALQVLKVGSKAVLPKIGKLIAGADKLQGDDISKASFRAKVADVFNFSASVPKESTKDLFKLVDEGLSIDEIFSRENLNPSHINAITDNIVKSVKNTRKNLGKEVGKSKSSVLREVKNRPVIDTADVGETLLADLKDVGVISRDGIFQVRGPFSAAERKFFKETLEDLGATNVKPGSFVKIDPKKLTFEEADLLKQRISQAATKFKEGAKRGSANSTTPRVLNRVLGGEIDDVTGDVVEGGIRNKMVQVAKHVGADDYVAANNNFSTFRKLQGALMREGLDIDNPIRMGSFLKKFEKKSPQLDRIVREFDNLLESGFVQDLEKFNVAQGFSGTNANFLRLGTIANLAGISAVIAPTPEGKITAGATGLLLGTPSGLRHLIKIGAGASSKVAPILKGAKASTKESIKRALNDQQRQRVTAALLAQLTKTSQPTERSKITAG